MESSVYAGYKYFGAAKLLPGVKELFEKEKPRLVRRTRHQMYAHIDADYYGFRDEEDGVLVKAEAEAEKALRKRVCSCRLCDICLGTLMTYVCSANRLICTAVLI